MLGTQQALEEARTKMTTAGSTLQNASDAIQVAENKAREVRSMGWGEPMVCWEKWDQCCGEQD